MPVVCLPALPSLPHDARGCSRSRGYFLTEALLCLAMVSLAALPLAMLGTSGVRAAGSLQALSLITRLAAEYAETLSAETIGAPPPPAHHPSFVNFEVQRCDAVSGVSPAGTICTPGVRLALAGPVAAIGNEVELPPHVALWVLP